MGAFEIEREKLATLSGGEAGNVDQLCDKSLK
jgi:hypothetical protein